MKSKNKFSLSDRSSMSSLDRGKSQREKQDYIPPSLFERTIIHLSLEKNIQSSPIRILSPRIIESPLLISKKPDASQSGTLTTL